MPKDIAGQTLLNATEAAEALGLHRCTFHTKLEDLLSSGILKDCAPWPNSRYRYVVVMKEDRKEVG